MGGSGDVIVVGAGITGASTAFHLARQGARTILLEREHPAAGPTGRSSAIVHAFYLLPELSRLAHRGTETLRHLDEVTGGGGHADFRDVGMLWVVGAQQAEEWRAAVERIRGEGADIDTVTVEQLANMAPWFEWDDVALGVWEPTCGYADPSSATNAMARGAQLHGAEVRASSPVRRLLVEGGRVRGVETAAGERLEAGTVVVATGPWTRPLVRAVGTDLPLTVERHPMAVVDAPGQAREVLPFAWCDDILTHYARPDGDDTILVGAWSGGGTGIRNPAAERPRAVEDPDVYRTSVDAEESSWILSTMTPRVPALSKLGVRTGYAGLYDMSPDDLPIIDAVPDAEGLYVAAGTSGHGFKLGPAVGEEVARLVLEGSAPLLAPFTLHRDFGGAA